MASTTVRQPSFASGELSPLLYGRTDHPRYGAGARTLRNFLVLPTGPLQNRPGSKLVASTKDPTAKARLIPFVFSTTQTYVLEFGNLYLRFHQNGGVVVAAGVPYEIVTPFTTAMLPYLKVAQVADTMPICYRGQDAGAAAITPQELKRLAHTTWTIGAAVFGPLFANVPGAPTVQIAAYNAGFNYQLGDRATNANQSWISIQNNNLGNAPAAASLFWALANDSAHPAVTWSWVKTCLVRQDSTGIVFETVPSVATTLTDALSFDRPVPIDPGVFGVMPPGFTLVSRRLYRGKNGIYGWIDDTDNAVLTYKDTGTAPDYSRQPPQSTQPFSAPANDFPAAVAFFEQRRMFGGQVSHPHRVQGSRTGQFYNFDVDIFVQSDDAVSFDLASLTLDEIRALIPLQAMVVPTQSGVYTVRGYQGSALTPTSVNARKHQHTFGASWVNPTAVSEAVIYEQDGGGAIYEFTYDAFYDVGHANDISAIAQHMLEGHTVVQMAYAARPRKTVWVVRDDGVLLGLTYVRSADPSQPGVVAWHQHTTDGLYESVCVVPEGTEDAVYVIVNRTVSGATKRSVERFATRLITDIRLACFLDAALSFDGRNTLATTMTVSGGVYTGGTEVPIAASVASFVADDLGSKIVIDPDAKAGGPFPATILVVTDSTHVTARLDANLAAAFQNVATTSWAFARRRFSGLGHIEGKTVAVLADGAVATAAKQDSSLVVTAGQITVDEPAVIVQAGLPYNSDLELLDIAGSKLNVKSIQRAAIEVVSSRGMWAGETLSKLKEAKSREVGDSWGNPDLKTGLIEVIPNSSWNQGGRAAFRQVDPLPVTIVAAIREIVVGGN